MAKQGDEVPVVREIRSALASTTDKQFAGFSLETTRGEVSFCLSFEDLGHLLSHALNLAEAHSKQMNRPAVMGGATVSVVSTPETVTVSHQDVAGQEESHLMVIYGELSLAFRVDPELMVATLEKFRGPSTSLKAHRLPRVRLPSNGSSELKLPNHRTPMPPLEISALPNNWAAYVGFIAVLWGDFEIRLNQIIEILAATVKHSLDNNWHRQEFPTRRQLFLGLSRRAFSSQPSIEKYCEILADDSAVVHVPRNLLAHGSLHGSVDNQGYILTAEGTNKGKRITGNFREAELLTLYYEVSNLCGRASFLLDPDDSPQKPQPFSSEAKDFLRDILNSQSTP